MSANWWDSAPQVNPLDAALQLEGATPQQAAIARSIYQQESGSGANTKTSNAGAVGGMQIIPSTFASMADKGWDINDPVQNARAGVRYIGKLSDMTQGDPRLTAIGYYGGPGAINKAKFGVAVSDPRNPNAPNTFQYADQVTGRIPAPAAANWWESAPVVDQPQAQPAGQDQPEQSTLDAVKAGVQGVGAGLGQGVGTVALNAQKYLGKGINAVSDMISPPERNLTSLITGQQPQGGNMVGNWLMNDADQGLKNLNAEVAPYQEASPIATKAGEFAGNFAATLPVGGVLGKAVGAAAPALGRVAPYAQRLAESLRTGGTSLGGMGGTGTLGTLGNIATRAAGGGATGFASSALVDPDSAATGGVIGAAFPLGASAMGSAASALGRTLRGGGVTSEVANLAARAEQLGIRIPADRIANSKPLNAVAASLNYVPFSGRAAVEEGMQNQLNRALTRTFGQDSENVTSALRLAETKLGGEFDRVLSSNPVKVDNQFLNDMATTGQRAVMELPEPQAGVIMRQIDEIINQASVQGNQLEGQLAYNIKRTLDRIGQRNSPEAWYATQLKKDLMGALDRSLGPQASQAFAKTRQQYGNMLSLRQLAQNGADGDISIARLANMKNINNPQLQELADISAQFLKPRESQHSAMQRVMAAMLAGGSTMGAGIPATVAGIGAARGVNALLNGNTVRNAMLGQPGNMALANALRNALPATAKMLPVLSAQ